MVRRLRAMDVEAKRQRFGRSRDLFVFGHSGFEPDLADCKSLLDKSLDRPCPLSSSDLRRRRARGLKLSKFGSSTDQENSVGSLNTNTALATIRRMVGCRQMARRVRPANRTPNDPGLGKRRTAGFALIGFLVFVPLSLTLLAGLGLFASGIKGSDWASSSCRLAVWNAQNEMARAMTELERLNPEARRLRLARRKNSLQLSLAIAAVQPELVALLKAERRLILAAQFRLRLTQEHWLSQARLSRQSAREKFSKRAWTARPDPPRIESKVIDLAVVRSPPLDASPDILPSPDFELAQKLGLSWKAELLRDSPKDWLRLLGLKPMRLEGRCAATLAKKGNKWRPILVADKS